MHLRLVSIPKSAFQSQPEI